MPKKQKKAKKAPKKGVKALKRPSKKVAKPASRKTKPHKRMGKKPESTGIYEEATITCPGCGRMTKVIKIAGINTEGMICQRCSKGEIEIEDMDF